MNHRHIYYKGTSWTFRAMLLTIAFLLTATAKAQLVDSLRQDQLFTEERPLVYEDADDLWPYAFLNDNGEAVGYNIDVAKRLLQELDIPYEIKLKPTKEVLKDIKTGKVDLTCSMDAHYRKDYGLFSKSVLQIFTHSILHRKDAPVLIKQVKDLSRHRIVVHEGSFSHYYMLKQGWGKMAVPRDNMREAVMQASQNPDIQIVWNTLSLKWLINSLQLDNLELTPLQMPHGEYKFMSNNQQLLNLLDSAYTKLNAEGVFQPIQNKWFYPERQEPGMPQWIWQVLGAMLLLALGAVAYYLYYHRREQEMTKNIRRSNKRLALVLQTSHVHIWLYDVGMKAITPFDQDGEKIIDQSPDNYFAHLTPTDKDKVLQTIRKIIDRQAEELTLDVQSKAAEDEAPRYYNIAISILRRDKEGNPAILMGTTSDITDSRVRMFQVKDSMLRYQTIFNSSMVDTIVYDAQGDMVDMNDKAASVFPGGLEGALKNRVNIRDVLGDPQFDLKHMEPIHMTRLYKVDSDASVFNTKIHEKYMFYEIQLIPLRDAEGRLQMVFGSGRDVTEVVRSYSNLKEDAKKLQLANDEKSKYISNIDWVLQNGGVRVITYSPTTHTLVIYSRIGKEQYRLTQTRALMLTADESKTTALKTLNSMDNRTPNTLKAVIKTALRGKDGQKLHLYVSFVPTLNSLGQVTEYFGMCRDISEIKATEELLAQETAKAQEVEAVKNAFLRNMSYEIRTPLNSVVGFAELFSMDHAKEDEAFFINEIKENSTRLLKLINDILFLSRLDAHMIEIKRSPVDFAAFFEPRCQSAWINHRNEHVEFVVDNPYQRLVVDIDEQNLGLIFDQLIANASEHTETGTIRAYYDYTGEELAITFQDTGSGIPEDRMQVLFKRFGSVGGKGTGLGLSICQEMAMQMGGRIRVKSEVGVGTIVWVVIPCKCLEIVRK